MAHVIPATNGVPQGISTCAVYSGGTMSESAELVATGVKAMSGPSPRGCVPGTAEAELASVPTKNANAAAAVPPVTTARRE